MQSNRRYVRGGILLAVGVWVGIVLVSPGGSGAQVVPTVPSFTTPSFTIPLPPTMPPPTTSTTSPPPTMPPPTTSPGTTTPPPTMPPITRPNLPPNIDDLIEEAIADLEEFGDRFAELIDELQQIRDRF